MANVDLLIKNIRYLFQVRESTPGFLAGRHMAVLPKLENAWLTIRDGLILDFGEMQNAPEERTAREMIDATGKSVFPSFVDSHTHLVFAASREEEFVMKIKGATYQEIAAMGGGILNSAEKVRSMPEDQLLASTIERAKGIIATGTGAVEIKSGYGLTTDSELKMLRVARKIGALTALEVKTTFLGAHAVPHGISKDAYLDLVLNEMIPAVSKAGLAEYIDIFCENGFFNAEETERVLLEGRKHGLVPRVHANQLNRSGGVQVGVKCEAISVDHLENIDTEEIEALSGSKTMPTSLPGAAFFLNLPFTPARRIIDAGLPMAIASDYNPGSAPSGNMLTVISLSCIKMKMTPEEAINAATINTAYAMGLLDSYGSITKGKNASLFITKPIPSLAYVPYSFGSNPIETVILKGKVQ